MKVGVEVRVAVAVLPGIDVGEGVGLVTGLATVKKTEEMTPHWLLSLLPCARKRCRPLEREVVSMMVDTLAVEPPKLPVKGIPEPSAPGSST